VPNGWKVAVIVDNDVWTAEIGYSEERDLPQYQFTRLNEEGNVLVQSNWCFTPSGAFKSASIEFIGDENAWGRHNGKLYLGCTYDYPQVFLRQYFQKKFDSGDHKWDDSLKAWVAEWLDPSKQSPKAVFNLTHNLGPASYAAKESILELDESAFRSTVDDNAEADSPSAATTVAAPEASTESPNKRLKFASEEARRAAAAARKRGIRKLTVNPETVAESEARAIKKVETVTVNWANRIWPEISADMFHSEAKLRRIFPGTPVYPSNAAQTRAMRSSPGAWLNEDEVLAILYHVDGQIQRIAMEKQMGGHGQPTRAFQTPTIGYIPTGAVKNVMSAVTKTKVVSDVVHVQIDHFLARLESIEGCAEKLYPILSQTLGLFSLDDIFKRLEDDVPPMPRETLDFIRARIRVLDVDSKDKFRVFANSGEFCRALTFLPRSSFVFKFVHELHFVAPALTLSAPTNMLPHGAASSIPTGFPGQFFGGPWMAAPRMAAGPAFFNMPVIINPFGARMPAPWMPEMPMHGLPPGQFFIPQSGVPNTGSNPMTNKQ